MLRQKLWGKKTTYLLVSGALYSLYCIRNYGMAGQILTGSWTKHRQIVSRRWTWCPTSLALTTHFGYAIWPRLAPLFSTKCNIQMSKLPYGAQKHYVNPTRPTFSTKRIRNIWRHSLMVHCETTSSCCLVGCDSRTYKYTTCKANCPHQPSP